VRVELVPLPMDPANKEEGYGAYVQGWLVFRPEERPGNGHRRLSRLPMTATESIQVAVGGGLPIMAASELLQLNVGQFLDEIDAKGPFAFFLAQASATVEAAEPTFHQDGFTRLLLPLWGNGYVSMLLGGIAR